MELYCIGRCPFGKDILNITYRIDEGETAHIGDLLRIELVDGSFLEREIKIINPLLRGDYCYVLKDIEQEVAAGKRKTSERKLSATGPCIATFIVGDVPYNMVKIGENISRDAKATGGKSSIFIGNFKEFSSSGTESIFDYFEDEPYQYQKEIAEYLLNMEPCAVCPTKVKDVVTGRYTQDTKALCADEDYAWINDLGYHVMAYNLRLPKFFKLHILANLGLLMNGNEGTVKYASYYEYKRLKKDEFIMISGHPIEGKDDVLKYMKSFEKCAFTTARVTDAATGFHVEGLTDDCYSDGIYNWYEGDIYHLEHYDVKLNNDFVNHVLDNI